MLDAQGGNPAFLGSAAERPRVDVHALANSVVLTNFRLFSCGCTVLSSCCRFASDGCLRVMFLFPLFHHFGSFSRFRHRFPKLIIAS